MLLSWDGSTAATQVSSQSMPQKDIEHYQCSFITHHLECQWRIALNPPDSNQIQCTILEDKCTCFVQICTCLLLDISKEQQVHL